MEHMQEIFEYLRRLVKEADLPHSIKKIADELKLDYEKIVRPIIDRMVLEGKVKLDETKEKIVEILD